MTSTSFPRTLTEKDALRLFNDAKLKKNPYKNSFMSTFCFHSSIICKKDRQYRLRKKALERVESKLDIRSFFKVHTNLALLLKLLLTEQQLFLFQHQKVGALHYTKDGDSSSSSSDGEKKVTS